MKREMSFGTRRRLMHWLSRRRILVLRRHPELHLAISHDPAGRDGIHTNIEGPIIPGQRTGQAENGGFAAV